MPFQRRRRWNRSPRGPCPRRNWAPTRRARPLPRPARLAVRHVRTGDARLRTPADDATLELVHAPAFIDATRRAGHGEPGDWTRFGYGPGDNPIFDRMHEAGAIVAGASVAAAEAVWTGGFEHAFNAAGGLHHAMPARASGFCVYDDPAIAIAWLLTQGCERIAYVDVDVHHGDGVEEIFYSEPDVLTISLHESGRFLFPGTGFPEDAGNGAGRGAAVNLPFVPFTWDEPWLEGFNRVVPPVLRKFRPTVLVTQDGCDTHYLDPLAHLAGTTRIWPHVGRAFHELAHELCEGRWVALGGGGYAVREVVPRAWTIFFAEMVERPDLAADLNDPESVTPGTEAQERVWAALHRDIARLGEVHGMKL
ncbi:MAG: acetoin utilization protein AcuC [Chloroflexi bacterium]|nr:MAG: acetoin utilization protein AcuC [Chloroflexota bacterium]